eukprot:7389242-Prymnesium_polylepis.1
MSSCVEVDRSTTSTKSVGTLQESGTVVAAGQACAERQPQSTKSARALLRAIWLRFGSTSRRTAAGCGDDRHTTLEKRVEAQPPRARPGLGGRH